MEIEFIDPKKAVNKFDPDILKASDIRKIPSERETLFKETYLACGNATASFRRAFPEKCSTMAEMSIRAAAAAMVKKFLLKNKTLKSVKRRNKIDFDNAISQNHVVEYVKKQYQMGLISEDELYARMDALSSHSTSDQARFNATKEMRQWVREARGELEANKLSALEIVPLLIDAISELPRSKYIEVLRGAKKRRILKNKEKSIIYNPDEIREKQRQDLIMKNGFQRD